MRLIPAPTAAWEPLRHVTTQVLPHLDVLDSAADQPAGLDRIPAHVEDLWEKRERRYSSGTPAGKRVCGGTYSVRVSGGRGEDTSSSPVPDAHRVLGIQADRGQSLWQQKQGGNVIG